MIFDFIYFLLCRKTAIAQIAYLISPEKIVVILLKAFGHSKILYKDIFHIYLSNYLQPQRNINYVCIFLVSKNDYINSINIKID